jgi:hypothetical protein
VSAALTVRCLQASYSAAPARGGQYAAERSAQTSVNTQPPEEVAFYRKYTEGMLRRYMYRSMEIGRIPSLLGEFSFRGKSSSRKPKSFEDSVIFVHDVEKCLKKLDALSLELVGKIALQEYTQAETAEMLGSNTRSVVRRYDEALDRLTVIFLRLNLMQVPPMR